MMRFHPQPFAPNQAPRTGIDLHADKRGLLNGFLMLVRIQTGVCQLRMGSDGNSLGMHGE